MFVGNMTKDDRWVGKPFLNKNWLESQYNLDQVTEEAIPTENFDGYCFLTIWKKKSAAELQKLRDFKGLELIRPHSKT